MVAGSDGGGFQRAGVIEPRQRGGCSTWWGRCCPPGSGTGGRSHWSVTTRPLGSGSCTRTQGRRWAPAGTRPSSRSAGAISCGWRGAEVRAGDRVPDRRKVVGRVPPEHPGGGVEGVGDSSADHPRREASVGSGVQAQDRPAVEQGREPARAAQGPALRPAGRHHQAAAGRPDRAGVVPDRIDQLGDHVGDRVLPAGRQGPAAKGRAVPGELLAHISPAHSENVNFFGVITVDVEAELAKLNLVGWRPLRPPAPDLTRLPWPLRPGAADLGPGGRTGRRVPPV